MTMLLTMVTLGDPSSARCEKACSALGAAAAGARVEPHTPRCEATASCVCGACPRVAHTRSRARGATFAVLLSELLSDVSRDFHADRRASREGLTRLRRAT